MSSICFYFQVHQPYRVRPYTCFQKGRDHRYFDDQLNREVVQKVAEKCYIPTNRALLDLIHRHRGAFKVSFAITGVAIEQMSMFAPEALQTFVDLAKTGCVEFIGETYYHSLAALYDAYEFQQQVQKHSDLMQSLFGQRPRVFRNTELIYSNEIGKLVSSLGFQGMIAEGADDILNGRSPNHVYSKTGGGMKLLLKNYALSDDVAFRFSNRAWENWPLTPEKYVYLLNGKKNETEVVNLFMDYETFGEHQWAETGIFDFLSAFPGTLMNSGDWNFLTPSEVIARYQPVGEMNFHRPVSWADQDRGITAWVGNTMQARAMREAYAIADEIRTRNNPTALEIWRRLLTSDHFYYMCTKFFADHEVHAYFSPYNSPYEAFLHYMEVLNDFKKSVLGYQSPGLTTSGGMGSSNQKWRMTAQ